MFGWIKGIVQALIIVPVVAVAVLLCVANRTPVRLILDPFSREAPALTASLPLYVLVLGTLAVGVLAGGIAAWLRQGVHRRNERQLRRDVDQLRTEVARLRQSSGQSASPAALIERKAA
jgi:uncharacterized integral membrane protein